MSGPTPGPGEIERTVEEMRRRFPFRACACDEPGPFNVCIHASIAGYVSDLTTALREARAAHEEALDALQATALDAIRAEAKLRDAERAYQEAHHASIAQWEVSEERRQRIERFAAMLTEKDAKIEHAEQRVAQLAQALALAKSMILSGERMSEIAGATIQAALIDAPPPALDGFTPNLAR